MNFFSQKNKDTKQDGFNPKVLEVNLIKDEIGVVFNAKKNLSSLLVMIIMAAALVAEVYFGLDWWQKKELSDSAVTDASYKILQEDLNKISLRANDVMAFKTKLSVIAKMADQHIYWSDFFNWLQGNTLNSVTFGSFSGDTGGQYDLTATTNNYRDISWQVKNFKDNKYVVSATVDEGTAGGGEGASQEESAQSTVSFNLKLQVKPELFLR